MKVWLNTTPPLPTTQDCDSDCSDCGDCCFTDSYSIPPLSAEEKRSLHVAPLTVSDPLYAQRCHDGAWLVCNPDTGGQVAVLDQQAFSLLELFRTPKTLRDAQSSSSTSQTVEMALALFYQLGFLQHLDQHRAAPLHKGDSPQTLSAWLHITNACNLRCHYCYLDKSSEHMAGETSFQAVNAVFRSAIAHRFKRVMLKYAGGEASLSLARILAVHDYATQHAQRHALHFYAYTMSNGVQLAQRTIEHFKARKIGVMISLDGIGEYHDSQRPFKSGRGSFHYVDRTISRLLASNLVPHINVTVSQRNLDGLTGLMEYILQREMPFTLSYYRDNDCSTHLLDLQYSEERMIDAMRAAFAVIERHLPRRRLLGSLIDKANMTTQRSYTCGVGRNYLVIDQHGGIAKCHADITKTVTTIHTTDPLQALRDSPDGVQAVPVEDKEGCRSCQWRHWCSGGCPLLTYRITGRTDIQSPNCNIYRALFPEALRLEALRLLKYEAPLAL